MANLFDIGMLASCIVVICFMHGPCTARSHFESLIDSILLFARNMFQFVRLCLLLKKYLKNMYK